MSFIKSIFKAVMAMQIIMIMVFLTIVADVIIQADQVARLMVILIDI
ncbi:MAG: hypothetical protein KTR28_07325 [Micavibrio sp.]|nr:hypothetical protein [Micavibrio sp.]